VIDQVPQVERALVGRKLIEVIMPATCCAEDGCEPECDCSWGSGAAASIDGPRL